MRLRFISTTLLTFTLLLTLSSYSHADSSKDDKEKPSTTGPLTKVVRLNEGNISVVYEGEDWFIMFEALWCSHCKKLWPTWVKLGEELDGKVKVGVVDAQSHIPVARSFGVLSYPTLHLIHDQRFFEYTGARDLQSLVEFATKVEELEEGTKLPLIGLTFYQTLQHMESRTAAMAFGGGAIIGLVFLGLFLYCADGANDEELAKIMQGIEKHKNDSKDTATEGTKDSKAQAESKKDR